MIELSLLKVLENKDYLESYKYLLNTNTLSESSITIIKAYLKYFEEFPDKNQIDWNNFKSFFFINLYPSLNEKDEILYNQIFKNLFDLNCDLEVETVVKGFEKQILFEELKYKIDNNDSIDIISELIENFNKRFSKFDETSIQVMDIEQAIQYIDRSTGLQWRCQSLRNHFNGGLIKGDFGIVAGYTNVGKTSFLASEMSHMATQLKEDSKILWFNTEGDWKRILPRIYCATLNSTIEDVKNNISKAKELYKNFMNNDSERIQIINAQGWHIKDIEKCLKKNKPSVIIFDMLDALRGFERWANKESSFERYGHLYQWALEISNDYAPVLATSQTNRNGNDIEKPIITELRGSGVDKQGAANFIIMIGKLKEGNNTRFLSTPKFKINGNEDWGNEVKFDSERSRFI